MFKKIRNFVKRSPKKSLIAGLVIAAAIVATPLVYAGYGPSDATRPTYNWNTFNSSLPCTDPANAYGRCGSMTGPVFDSFINTPAYGDEENFNQIAPVVAGESPLNETFADTATATPGQQYWVRTYVHNDANQTLNCEPAHVDTTANDCTQVDPGSPSIATGTKVSVQVSNTPGNNVEVMSNITANNSSPADVWDSASLVNNNQTFTASYVPGSAEIYNDYYTNGLALPDAIDTATGTPIGYSQMDGNLPGCFNFSAYVYVKVQVNQPALTIQKQVRLNTSDAWSSSVTANTGAQEEWRITYADSGSATDDNVSLSDLIPQGLTLVPNSIKWYDPSNNGAVQNDSDLPTGINFGNAAPVGSGQINGQIEFYTTVNNTVPACTLTNTAYGWADNIPKTSSTASVNVGNCVVPNYACTNLTVAIDNEQATITKFTTTAENGAAFKDVSVNWGDGTSLLTNNVVNDNIVTPPHTYSAPGPFTITATANFTVPNNNASQPATSTACTVAVTATTPPTTPTAPTPPAQLPNTGAGTTGLLVGIFTAAAIAGTVFHNFISKRRNSISAK